jgi:hypothetical protein
MLCRGAANVQRQDQQTSLVHLVAQAVGDRLQGMLGRGELPERGARVQTLRRVYKTACPFELAALEEAPSSVSRAPERLPQAGGRSLHQRLLDRCPAIDPATVDQHIRISDVAVWMKGISNPAVRESAG